MRHEIYKSRIKHTYKKIANKRLETIEVIHIRDGNSDQTDLIIMSDKRRVENEKQERR